jgi:hypothetical protein
MILLCSVNADTISSLNDMMTLPADGNTQNGDDTDEE